jgi:hypothetical protein
MKSVFCLERKPERHGRGSAFVLFTNALPLVQTEGRSICKEHKCGRPYDAVVTT